MKNKIIISSILTIAMCFSLIAGSTFALFTSESKVDVSVSSATVSVTATPSAPVMGSTLGTALGTATANGNSLTLENFVPGDYATFSIAIANASNVAVKYRTVISVSDDNGLVSGLVVTIGADVYTGTTGNGELASTDWTLINPTEGNTSVDVKIALPEEAGNVYQGKTCTITYLVEAVQGNYVQATKVNNVTELKDALTAAQPGEIIDATGVETSVAGMATSTAGGRNSIELSSGVTIKGLTLDFASANDNFLLKDSAEAGEIVFENCTFTSPDFDGTAYFQNDANTANTKVVFNNCTFASAKMIVGCSYYPKFGEFEFNNCTFNLNSNGYGLVQCMGGNTVFNKCTFNISGSASFGTSSITKYGHVNLYAERTHTEVTFNQCTGVPAIHRYTYQGTTNYTINP